MLPRASLSSADDLILAAIRSAGGRGSLRTDLRQSHARCEDIVGAAIECNQWRPIGRHADQSATADAGLQNFSKLRYLFDTLAPSVVAPDDLTLGKHILEIEIAAIGRPYADSESFAVCDYIPFSLGDIPELELALIQLSSRDESSVVGPSRHRQIPRIGQAFRFPRGKVDDEQLVAVGIVRAERACQYDLPAVGRPIRVAYIGLALKERLRHSTCRRYQVRGTHTAWRSSAEQDPLP